MSNSALEIIFANKALPTNANMPQAKMTLSLYSSKQPMGPSFGLTTHQHRLANRVRHVLDQFSLVREGWWVFLFRIGLDALGYTFGQSALLSQLHWRTDEPLYFLNKVGILLTTHALLSNTQQLSRPITFLNYSTRKDILHVRVEVSYQKSNALGDVTNVSLFRVVVLLIFMLTH